MDTTHNVCIWWQGKSGMLVNEIPAQIRIMLKYEEPPPFLVLHVGGNDIGKDKIGYLRNRLKTVLRIIAKQLPQTTLVWSQILPRYSYRYSDDNDAMEKCRYRLNNSIAKFVIGSGGKYIRHTNLFHKRSLFATDGVHLTSTGNNIFLKNLQNGLEYFVQNLKGADNPRACPY